MAKDLSYYKNLSEQYKKDISTLEESYKKFEENVDLNKKNVEYTENEKKVSRTFGDFCRDEGFSKTAFVTNRSYTDIKEAILERISFLEKQKEKIDRMVDVQEELDTLNKSGKISEEDIKKIKQSKKLQEYEEGTSEYNSQYRKIKNTFVEKKKDSLKKRAEEVKNEIKQSKKENSFGKVATEAVGPIGRWFYNNLYVPVQNANVNLRKHKVLNFVVKAAACAGAFALTSLIPGGFLAGVPFVCATGVSCVSLYNTIKHTFEKVPDKKEKVEKSSSLKERWFRFWKSRGKGSLTKNESIYKGLDLRESVAKSSDKGEETKPEDKSDDKGAKGLKKETDDHTTDKTDVPTFDEVVRVDSLDTAKQIYESLKQKGGCKNLTDWKNMNNAKQYLFDEFQNLRDIGSGRLSPKMTDTEREYNKRFDEVCELNRKFNEITKNENEVVDRVNKMVNLSLHETVDIDSLEGAVALNLRFVKSGGIKTKADYESCINAFNYLKGINGTDEKEEASIRNLEQIFLRRLDKINKKHKDGNVSLDGELNEIYESIRLNSDTMKVELSEFEKKNLSKSQKAELLKSRREEAKKHLSRMREAACTIKFNQLVSMFDTCNSFEELISETSDFIVRAGNSISEEQKNQLIFLLSNKKNQLESVEITEEVDDKHSKK